MILSANSGIYNAVVIKLNEFSLKNMRVMAKTPVIVWAINMIFPEAIISLRPTFFIIVLIVRKNRRSTAISARVVIIELATFRMILP